MQLGDKQACVRLPKGVSNLKKISLVEIEIAIGKLRSRFLDPLHLILEEKLKLNINLMQLDIIWRFGVEYLEKNVFYLIIIGKME